MGRVSMASGGRSRELERAAHQAEKDFQRYFPKTGRRFQTGGGTVPPDFVLNGNRILDLAVGPQARVAIPMARAGAYVVGQDLSEESLELAAARIKDEGLEDRIELVHGDSECMEFPDAFFDGVVILNVLSHFPSKRSALDQLRESARVLKPGGQLFLRDFGNALCPLAWQYILLASVIRPLLRRRGKLHYVTPWTLERAFYEAGLEILRREMRLPPRFILFDYLPPKWHDRAYAPFFSVFGLLERTLARLELLSVLGYEYRILSMKRAT